MSTPTQLGGTLEWWASVCQPDCPSRIFLPLPTNCSTLGCVGSILALIWQKIDEDGWNLWFPTIIQNTCCLSIFKLGMYTCLMNLQNLFTFGMHWPNFSAIYCQKLTENGVFLPLSRKIITLSTSSWCNFTSWVNVYFHSGPCLPNYIPLVSIEKWLKIVFFLLYPNPCNRM